MTQLPYPLLWGLLAFAPTPFTNSFLWALCFPFFYNSHGFTTSFSRLHWACLRSLWHFLLFYRPGLLFLPFGLNSFSYFANSPSFSPFRASPAASLNFCTVERVNSSFYLCLLTFSNTLSNRLSIIFSISFKYHFFNHSLFVFYYHLFFLYSFPTIIFFNKKCYIHNIFCNTFTRIISKSYMENCY